MTHRSFFQPGGMVFEEAKRREQAPRRCFGRLYLRLNDSETPAMVFVQSRGRTVDSGTYWRVREEGFDSVELTDAENDWLDAVQDIVEAHVNALPSRE